MNFEFVNFHTICLQISTAARSYHHRFYQSLACTVMFNLLLTQDDIFFQTVEVYEYAARVLECGTACQRQAQVIAKYVLISSFS